MITSNIPTKVNIGFCGRYLNEEETDQQIIEIKNILKSQHLKPDQTKWQDIWTDHLNRNTNTPKWLTDNNKIIYRLDGKYIKTNDAKLEKEYVQVLRKTLFEKYFKHMDTIIEFGAGTGHNMIEFKQNFKNKNVWTSDFVESALNIQKKSGLNNFYYDMALYAPYTIPKRTFKSERVLAFTFGAMEQLGDNYIQFYDSCKNYQFDLVVHIEPLRELYSTSEFDRLALEYHDTRGYLGNYFSFLKLQKQNIVEVIRTGFGNMFNEGYMVLVWTP